MPFTLRPLEQGDLSPAVTACPPQRAPVNLTPEEAIHIWRGRNAAGVRTVVAISDDDRVIGTASLILEHKFLHRGGTIGHIEDVSVHPNTQGQGVGSAVVRALVDLARQSGCYKVILSCNDQNLAFYSKLGFRRHDNGMRIDLQS